MSILSTNKRLIKVGQDYSAGSGISIDDGVISVTGEFGKTYSAGENIDIYEQDEQLYISSKDWSDDIANASANAYNAATAQIPDPFDPSYLSAQIDNKLNSSDFTTWQNGQYTTDLQTIEGQITNKLDESAFSSVSASFLTAINIPESATWNEVSQAYEQASGTYLTSISIPESATWQDVSTTVQTNSAQWAEGGTGDEEVNSFVYNNSANILDVDTTYQQNSASYLTSHQDISYKLDTTAFSTVSGDFLTAAPADMATTGDVAELAQTISETYQVKGDYLTTADSANFYPMTGNPSGFITGVDLSNYYTKDETSGKEELSNAFANVPAPDYEVESYIHNNSASIDESTGVVQSNSSTWSDVTVYQSNSGSYLTGVEIPESATWNEVSTTVQTNSSVWDNVTNKLDSTAFNLPDSATWNEVSTAYQNASATYLTAVDLSPYATTAEVDTLSSMLSGAIDYVSANAGDEFPISADEAIQYVENNSATINDVNTSYQTNSGTFLTAHQAISAEEWNSNYETVNTNSGVWGGSALPISAGPGIKVNLVDNTLVFSNDETVLWEGTAFTPEGSNNPVATSVSLNENFNNFNQIRLDFSKGEFFTDSVLLTEPTTARKCYICVKKEQNNNDIFIGTHYKFTSDTTLSGYCSYGSTQNIGAMNGGYWGYGGVVRVVGINRK